ncbi:uncharacterized protein LOC124479619 [Hypomesus transpacificus]|uniref:uncharacterized protein LOC124479619 n=1 Tax=Hypomesus transpacificus TaxID=137520 RepID=UPI001F077016|nr:uncharacterized protein LOC124479619 [Hypomesus transpacificus]
MFRHLLSVIIVSGLFRTVSGQIRLVNGTGHCSGRVEVYYNNEWGTVCDDSWYLKDAEVVCRQLGCGRALSAPGNAHFGRGSGKIWLDDVGCSGGENSLTQCSHDGYGKHNCKPEEDAGVVCTDTTPHLSISPAHSAFSPGEDILFTCSVPSQNRTSVQLLRPGSIRSDMIGSGQSSTTFTLPSVEPSNQGNYSCRYQTQINGQITSPYSDSVSITIVSLPTPSISLTSSQTLPLWLARGSEIKGHGFSITCSVSSQYPGGSFSLVSSGSSSPDPQPALNQSASFSFPSAEDAHQGNYSCVYRVDVSGRMFSSTSTEELSVTVRGLAASLTPLLVSVAVGVVLLVGLVALFLVCRKRRGRHTLPKTNFRMRKQNPVTVSNTAPGCHVNHLGDTNQYGGRTAVGDGEEEEENDYVSAEDDYVNVEGLTCQDDDEDEFNDQTDRKGSGTMNQYAEEASDEKEDHDDNDYESVDDVSEGNVSEAKNQHGTINDEEDCDDDDYENVDIFEEKVSDAKHQHGTINEEEDSDDDDDYVNVDISEENVDGIQY